MKIKYPTMRTITVSPRGEPRFYIDATINLDGKPQVEVRVEDSDEMSLTPTEADRLSLALAKAARIARAKRAWSISASEEKADGK